MLSAALSWPARSAAEVAMTVVKVRSSIGLRPFGDDLASEFARLAPRCRSPIRRPRRGRRDPRTSQLQAWSERSVQMLIARCAWVPGDLGRQILRSSCTTAFLAAVRRTNKENRTIVLGTKRLMRGHISWPV